MFQLNGMSSKFSLVPSYSSTSFTISRYGSEFKQPQVLAINLHTLVVLSSNAHLLAAINVATHGPRHTSTRYVRRFSFPRTPAYSFSPELYNTSEPL